MKLYICLFPLLLLTLGLFQGCETTQKSQYASLVGETRLSPPRTLNRCQNAANGTSMLANNASVDGQVSQNQGNSSNYCQPTGYKNGWYMQDTSKNRCADPLDNPQQQVAASKPPLHWKPVEDPESQQQLAVSSPTNVTSAGVASAVTSPAFGSSAPANAANTTAGYNSNPDNNSIAGNNSNLGNNSNSVDNSNSPNSAYPGERTTQISITPGQLEVKPNPRPTRVIPQPAYE